MTWISEDAGPAATIDAILAVAPYFGLDTKRVNSVLTQVERAVSTWRSVGHDLGMSQAELDQFADAFEHRERDAVRLVLRQ